MDNMHKYGFPAFMIDLFRRTQKNALLPPRVDSKFLQTIKTDFVQIPPFAVHFLQKGKGNPLILIHGGGSWLYTFRKNIPVLSRKFTVHALDMPGHGYTRVMNGKPRYDFNTTRYILSAFMKKMSINKASLVGHSWGGGFIIDFAAHHPEKVDKLILMSSSGIPGRDKWEWEILKFPLVGEFAIRLMRRHHIKQGLIHSYEDPHTVTEAMIDEIHAPLKPLSKRYALCAYKRNLDFNTTAKALSHIKHPVLILWGDHDAYLPVTSVQAFCDRLKNVQSIILKNCGHTVHEEYPAIVNQAITDFLDTKR